jgi:hypothetical protein
VSQLLKQLLKQQLRECQENPTITSPPRIGWDSNYSATVRYVCVSVQQSPSGIHFAESKTCRPSSGPWAGESEVNDSLFT